MKKDMEKAMEKSALEIFFRCSALRYPEVSYSYAYAITNVNKKERKATLSLC